LLFGVLLFNVGTASAKSRVDVGSIDVRISETGNFGDGDDRLDIEVGEEFYVHIELENPEENETDLDIDVEITIDGVKVYDDREKNIDLIEDEPYVIDIRSKDFEDEWDENVMDCECGRKKIKVTVSGDIKSESGSAEIDLDGDRLKVEVEPDKPSADDKITVTVIDDYDDDELEDVTVKFTHLGDDEKWDDDDDNWDDETDRHGEVEVVLSKESAFRRDPYGKYQIDVWDKNEEYCKVTQTIDLKRSLFIKEVTPSSPIAGEKVKVKITDEDDKGVSGAKITLSSTGFHETYTADSGGYASFTLSKDGNYILIASKSGYSESTSKTLVVSAKKGIMISINPKEQELNKAVEITVMDDNGNALENARVTITKPDGSTEPAITVPSSGKISYTPRLVGTYSIMVEESKHMTTTDDFRAQRVFSIIVPDEVKVNKDITIVVSDSAGNPVEGATVSIGGTTISGKTDSGGKFTFKLSEPKEYAISISKEGYSTLSRKISTLGKLKIKLDSNDIELGNSVKIDVVDGQGNVVSANIEITKPDGSKESISTNSYTPTVAGNYGITASKKDYESDTESLLVRPYPLVLESRIRDNTLIVSVSSRGNPVPDIRVQVETSSWRKEIVTDETGIGTLYLTNLELSSDLTIGVDGEGYEKKTITQELPRFDIGNYSIPVIFGFVIVIAIIIILIASSGVGKRKKKVKKEGAITTKKGSSLDRV